MFEKISKISLDHCLLDAKGIMQKYSCNNFVPKKGRGPATPFWAVWHA
jgi:hypothetical protein